MKALLITAPGRTEFRDIQKPSPGDGEVLLRVRLVGYCGSDLNTFRGRNPMVSLPRIPGHEVGATIEALGPGVPTQFKTGMDVTLSPYLSCGKCAACRRGRSNACQHNQTLGVQREGALTDYIVAPWQKLFFSPKLSLRELAWVEPLTVGYHAANRGEVSEKDTVAVFGCGAIGLGAIAGAAHRQATVIAIDIDDGKLAGSRRAGATHTINSAKQDLHATLEAIVPGGPDVVIEAIGLPQTFRAAVDEVAYTGRVVYIGYAKESVNYDTRLFVQKELDIRGSRNAQGEFAEVIAMLEQGRFPAELFTRDVPFEKAGEALREWSDDPALVTKIHIDLSA